MCVKTKLLPLKTSMEEKGVGTYSESRRKLVVDRKITVVTKNDIEIANVRDSEASSWYESTKFVTLNLFKNVREYQETGGGRAFTRVTV